MHGIKSDHTTEFASSVVDQHHVDADPDLTFPF